MRKFLSIIVMLLVPIIGYSANYVEGEHYTKVSEQASKKAEVREYFSFYCPHCMKFEPFMEEVKKSLPDGVAFELNHVDFLRMASPKIQAMLSKALVVAQQLDMEKELTAALFNYIQVQRAIITTEKDIRNIFVLNGADGDKFDKLMTSFTVNSKAKLMKKNQDTLAKSGGLTGVPSVMVNGQYRINPQALDKKDFVGDYNQLIAYLLTLK